MVSLGTRSSRARLPFVAVTALAIVASLAGGPCRPALADQPWEQAIREGIADQDAELLRSSAKALVHRLESSVGREKNLSKLFLLARAYAREAEAETANATASAEAYGNSITTYGEAIQLEPNCYFAYAGRAYLRALRNDPKGLEAAEADLLAAVRMKPDFLDALRLLADVQRKLKKNDAALATLERIVGLTPNDETPRVKIIQVYLEQGKGDDALRGLVPLLDKHKSDPGLRLMQGTAHALRKDWKAALAVFKRLGEENPNRAEPFRAYYQTILFAQKAGDKDVASHDDILWMLQALRRLALTEEERKGWSAIIDQFGKPASDPSQGGGGPPTAEQQILLLQHSDPKVREGFLRWLYHVVANPEKGAPPPKPLELEVLTKGVLPRIGFHTEPNPVIRSLAIKVVAAYGGPALAQIVRHSLRDEDAGVRVAAADALLDLATPAAILALVPYTKSPDLDLSNAARVTILGLAHRRGLWSEGASPEEQAKAFDAWWASEEAHEAKKKAIDAVVELGDIEPDEVLFPLCFTDPDPEVWPAAYRALKTLANGERKLNAAYDAWLRSLPNLGDDVLVAARRKDARDTLADWYEKKPK